MISGDSFFDFLKKRRGLLDGCVLCGGEPTVQDGLLEFVAKIKDLGFLVKLDTNGSNSAVLEKLIEEELVDYAALDIKAPKSKYGEVIGINEGQDTILKNIIESVNILKKDKIDFEFRTTVVPGLLKKSDFLNIAKWIGGKNVKYFLQSFQVGDKGTIDPQFQKVKPYSDSYLVEIQEAIQEFFQECNLR